MGLTRINTLAFARKHAGAGSDLIDSALESAFRNGRVALAAQPIHPTNGGRGHGRWVELLVRPSVNGARLSAESFVGRAMERGVARKLDLLVFETGLQWLRECRDIRLCSINVSGDSISQPRFLREVMRLIERSDVNPGRLCIEITETAPIHDFPTARDFAREMRASGCKLALDDFGGGSSNMMMLVPMEMDYLKIDGRFIQPMPTREDCRRIVRGVIAFAVETGLETVAECVEEPEHFRLAEEMNVDYVQGYHDQGAPRMVELQPSEPRCRGFQEFEVPVPGAAR